MPNNQVFLLHKELKKSPTEFLPFSILAEGAPILRDRSNDMNEIDTQNSMSSRVRVMHDNEEWLG